MIKFGDIRQILDKYTSDCRGCNYYPENCSLECDTYWCKVVKDEILELLDKEEVKTDSISMIPCKLSVKGSCAKLPEKAEDGDCYTVLEHRLENGYGWQDQHTFYWYDNKWNYLEAPPEHCKIQYL